MSTIPLEDFLRKDLKEREVSETPSDSPDLVPLFSSPLSRGTASSAVTKKDGSPSSSANLDQMTHDLLTTSHVSLVGMLRALLQRLYENQQDICPSRTGAWSRLQIKSERWAYKRLVTLLDDAIDFCNSTSEYAKTVRTSIASALGTRYEKDRYYPLVQALNAILMHYSDPGNHALDGLPAPQSGDNALTVAYKTFPMFRTFAEIA